MTSIPPPPGQEHSQPAAEVLLPPPDVALIRVFFIISLIVNALATMGWLVVTVIGGAHTCGVGCLLIVVPFYTGASAVMDAMALAKSSQRPAMTVRSFLIFAAIADMAAGLVGLSLVPLIMGILILISLQKPEVRRYFSQI